MENKTYSIWLQLACGFANTYVKKLYKSLGSIEHIYLSSDYSFTDLPKNVQKKLLSKDLTEAERILRLCNRQGVKIVTPESRYYSDALRDLKKMPAALYCLGSPELLVSKGAAIVGSRTVSETGMRNAYAASHKLASNGVTVFSGMARGIDSASHRGALDANGHTVAVLGTSIDKAYPAENAAMYNIISEKGCVVSEYFPGAATNRWDFAERNRIISALSQVVFIGECGSGSGALITAKHAREQGKPICCLPTMPTDNYSGALSLVRDGAETLQLATDAYDAFVSAVATPRGILAVEGFDRRDEVESQPKPPKPKPKPEVKPEVKAEAPAEPEKPAPEPKSRISETDSIRDRVLRIIAENGPVSSNKIVGMIKANPQLVLAALTYLEITHKIERIPVDRYKISIEFSEDRT